MLCNKPVLKEQQHLSSIFNTQHADLGAHFPCVYRQIPQRIPCLIYLVFTKRETLKILNLLVIPFHLFALLIHNLLFC